MSKDQNILLTLKLHDDRLQSNNYITVRFASTIPVVELVFVSICEVIWVRLLGALSGWNSWQEVTKLILRFPIEYRTLINGLK